MSVGSLPDDWEAHWTLPSEEAPAADLRAMKASIEKLAREIPLEDCTGRFGALVGSAEMRDEPVHRWFTYKEGFSPFLLREVLDYLAASGPLKVADAFGGVATTALAALGEERVAQVRSVEYSPFAHFAGRTKLSWPWVDLQELEQAILLALAYDHTARVEVPGLSTFSNSAIFNPQRLRSLLAARDHVRSIEVSEPVRDVLLLGVAAVVEDLSGAMKDGRALRIKGDRRRRPSSLASTPSRSRVSGTVKQALAGQWTAMAADVSRLQARYPEAKSTATLFVQGDARALETISTEEGRVFPGGWADLALFSPPYLNCLDYTELYKLELWLLQFVVDQAEFRQTRLGTLRSHPSVKFPRRDYLKDQTGPAVRVVQQMSAFASSYGRRNDVGPTILTYFEDMFEVWRQHRLLIGNAGTAVCVVANSTFSRRERNGNELIESWRFPVLTDVVLAALARLAGFDEVKIVSARHLRPRNAGAATARESLIVASRGGDRPGPSGPSVSPA